MTATGREEAWALALKIARDRHDRGYLREFTPETVIDAADEIGLDVSARTIRRAIGAMAETGVLEQVDDDPLQYRLAPSFAPLPDGDDTSDDAATSADYADLGDDDLGLASGDDLLIYHLYADTGVESEPLSAYGDVVRVGLDPQRTRFSHAIQADATEVPLQAEADLAVLHPPCQRWSTMTHVSGDPDEWPDLLDEARRVGRQLADHYVIENVPQAPLKEPVILSGQNFGLPVVYRRAFETSFHVPQPPEPPELVDRSGPFADDEGGLGDWRGDKRLWRAAKQVAGDYPARDLKNAGIPAPYIHYLMRWFLRARRSAGRATDVSQSGREVLDTSVTARQERGDRR